VAGGFRSQIKPSKMNTFSRAFDIRRETSGFSISHDDAKPKSYPFSSDRYIRLPLSLALHASRKIYISQRVCISIISLTHFRSRPRDRSRTDSESLQERAFTNHRFQLRELLSRSHVYLDFVSDLVKCSSGNYPSLSLERFDSTTRRFLLPTIFDSSLIFVIKNFEIPRDLHAAASVVFSMPLAIARLINRDPTMRHYRRIIREACANERSRGRLGEINPPSYPQTE